MVNTTTISTLARKYYCHSRLSVAKTILTAKERASFDSLLMPLLMDGPQPYHVIYSSKDAKMFDSLLLTNSFRSMPIFYSILVNK